MTCICMYLFRRNVAKNATIVEGHVRVRVRVRVRERVRVAGNDWRNRQRVALDLFSKLKMGKIRWFLWWTSGAK